MAAHGYERERFESTVIIKRYHCPICLNVFKDPVMCRRNEHPFCRGCIIRHLTNDQTCPVCKDYLTLDTLTKPSRFLTELLSELRIRCEFVERGCEEFVQLQYLEKHVEKCGYAPVPCSNEGCQLEVNRRDLTHHEFVECEHRKLKCHHCERLSKDVDILKQKVTGMEEKFDTACANVYAAVEVKLDSFQKNLKDQQKNMDDSLRSLKRSNSSIKGNLKKLIKVMESLPKKSTVETDNDDSASDSPSSGSDSSSSTPSPSRATSVNILPTAESISSPSISSPSRARSVNTVPRAESNSSSSTSTPSRPTSVNTVPRAESNSSSSTSKPFRARSVDIVPRTANNSSSSTSTPSRARSVDIVPRATPSRATSVNNIVPRAGSNSSSSTSDPFRPPGVNIILRAELESVLRPSGRGRGRVPWLNKHNN